MTKCRNTAIMKSIITVTSRGVVTLPSALRKALGIKADDTLIAETTPDGLLLRPAVTLPVEIYTDERIREFDESEQELAAAMRRPAAAKAARRKGRACPAPRESFWMPTSSSRQQRVTGRFGGSCLNFLRPGMNAG